MPYLLHNATKRHLNGVHNVARPAMCRAFATPLTQNTLKVFFTAVSRISPICAVFPPATFPTFPDESSCGIKAAHLGIEVKDPHTKSGDRQATGLMTTFSSKGLSRRALLGAFAASAVAAAPSYSNAFGLLRGAGDIRRIRMYSGRTGESMDTIYWIEGDYIKDALKEINYFMRDWRTDQTVGMDARTVDIMAASHSLLNINEPYMLLSGYRSPQTNAMLRSRSRGVARNSLHMKGQAADLRLKSRSVSQMAQAAAACASGGVGTYSRSNFVHMDCGTVRTWRG